VRVSGLSDGKVGEATTFTVDASQAGEGTLELVVTTGKQSLRAEVQARSRGLYDVTFIPQEPTMHYVNITFNDIEVIGSPFECAVGEESYSTIGEGSSSSTSAYHFETMESHVSKSGIISSGLDTVIAGTTAFIDLEKRGNEIPEISVSCK